MGWRRHNKVVNLILEVLFILILIGATINILKGIRDRGDEINSRASNGKTLIILPTKNPPSTINDLVKEIVKYTRNTDLYIVYQGIKPSIEVNKSSNDVTINVVEGGETPEYKGKIGNIASVLNNIDISKYRYFIIIDDDILIHPMWFENLKSLAEHMEFSTGYRIYLPVGNGIGPILTSVWNLYTVDTIYSREERIVWGGSACIKTDAINISTIMKYWRGAVSDDVPLTYIARCKKGIGFNEYTLVPSLSIHTLREALEFIIRQQRIVYVYNRALWLKGVLIHLFLNIISLIAFIDILEMIIYGLNPIGIIKIIGISSIFLSYTLKNHIRLNRYQKIFGEALSTYLNKLKLYNLIFTPIILLIQLYLLIQSRGREIMWRGSRYTLPTMEELGYSECIKTS